MWGSMSRKPGQPADYLGEIYKKVLLEQRIFPSGVERYPEAAADRVWEAIIKKLFQKDYKFDAGFYGSLNEYAKKVAYFFHASLQGTACYPGADLALRAVTDAGLTQGLCADGQCFTVVQLRRGLDALGGGVRLDDVMTNDLRLLSSDVRGRKPSERLFRQALDVLEAKGIGPEEVLHVGSRIDKDIVPAKKLGVKTALFAGDRASLAATTEQLKDPASKPSVLLTDLGQIADVIG